MAAFVFAPSLLFISSVLAEKRSAIQLATLGGAELPSKATAVKENIEENMWHTFQALPKNEYGRLDVGIAAAALQRHFARERHWHVKADSEVVQSALMKVNQASRGFTSRSLTEAISIVETAITNEPRDRLLATFAAGNASCADAAGCSVDELKVILTAYMKAFLLTAAPLPSPAEVADELQCAFEARHGSSRRNPFEPQTYSFQDVLSMVEQFERDLEDQSRDVCQMQMSSDSTCFVSGRQYAVCCVSQCETIISELEAKLQAPVVSPDRLIRVVSKMSLSTVEAVPHVPLKFQKQLELIGDQHGGDVPLHGDDVAAWLHLVFPSECPLPGRSVQQHKEQATATRIVEFARSWAVHHVQDLARIAVLFIVGVTMLRAVMAQWQTANGALKDASGEEENLKKPADLTTTTYV